MNERMIPKRDILAPPKKSDGRRFDIDAAIAPHLEKRRERYEKTRTQAEGALDAFEMHPGEHAEAGQVASFVQEHAESIVAGVRRNFHNEIRLIISGARERAGTGAYVSYDHGKAFRFSHDREGDRNIATVMLPLTQEQAESGVQKWSLNGPALDIAFSMDRQDADALYRTNGDTFVPSDTFDFHHIGLSQKWGREEALIQDSEGLHHDERLSGIAAAEVTALSVQLQDLLQNESDCSESIARLRLLSERFGVEPDVLKRMEQAITVFAAYYHREPVTHNDCAGETGACLSVPSRFCLFASQSFDLRMRTAHYGDSVSCYHEVNTFEGKIVVDWTARQYPALIPEAFPYIYPLDEYQRYFTEAGTRFDRFELRRHDWIADKAS